MKHDLYPEHLRSPEGDTTATNRNGDPRRTHYAWDPPKVTKITTLVNLVEKKCSGEVKRDGSVVLMISTHNPEQLGARSRLHKYSPHFKSSGSESDSSAQPLVL